jgi:RHS repeat-associated protein
MMAMGSACRRLRRAGTTVYVYDALGQLAAEYSTVGGSTPCYTCYLIADHLGSTRLVTDENGTVVARHDFLSFGEEIGAGGLGEARKWGAGNDSVRQTFTAKERDAETGLDFFESRYLSGTLGRFTSTDDPFAGQDSTDPQSWNLYSYGLNNPLRYTDPDGHAPEDDVPTFRGTGTGYLGLDPLEELLYRYFFQDRSRLAQIGQQTQQMARQAFNWVGAPRDSGCMTAHTMGGAGVGLGGGATLGAFFGPADVLTIPTFGATGFVGGAAFGRIGGLISCMSGTGDASGGGGQASSGQTSSKDFWKKLKPFRGKTKTNGLQGKAKRFFEWDHTHGDVEVYDSRGQHLGSANPDTGEMTKPAVPGRRIEI